MKHFPKALATLLAGLYSLPLLVGLAHAAPGDRKSTRLNSSH